MRRFVAFILGFTLMWGLLGTKHVLGQDMRGNGMFMGTLIFPNTVPPMVCPPDKPIRKTVDSGFATCTLVACIGKLVCPASVAPGSPDCYRAPASDCNTCTRSVLEICLSQQELDAAK